LFADKRAISDDEKNIEKIIPVNAKNKIIIMLNLINNIVETPYQNENK